MSDENTGKSNKFGRVYSYFLSLLKTLKNSSVSPNSPSTSKSENISTSYVLNKIANKNSYLTFYTFAAIIVLFLHNSFMKSKHSKAFNSYKEYENELFLFMNRCTNSVERVNITDSKAADWIKQNSDRILVKKNYYVLKNKRKCAIVDTLKRNKFVADIFFLWLTVFILYVVFLLYEYKCNNFSELITRLVISKKRLYIDEVRAKLNMSGIYTFFFWNYVVRKIRKRGEIKEIKLPGSKPFWYKE